MTDLGSATKDSTTVSSERSHPWARRRPTTSATRSRPPWTPTTVPWICTYRDQSDPVIKAWEKIFPGQYHQLSDISGDLMSHMRYPESLFKVQRELLSKYHVTSANQYYSGEDFWQTPVDPTESQSQQARTSCSRRLL